MRTLHSYLTRQVLATLAMTVLVFTFVLLLGSVLKQIMLLLLNQHASLRLIAEAFALLIPFILAFSLPMGMMAAALLVFGRFSADQELTAARASGISLLSLVTPVLLLAVALSVLCAWINLEIAPAARVAYKQMLFRVGMEQPTSLLREGQYVQDLPDGYTVYVKKIRGSELQDIKVYHVTPEWKRWLQAPSGRLVFEEENQRIVLTLIDAFGAERKGNFIQPLPQLGEIPVEIDLRPQAGRAPEPKLTEMTFRQLRHKLHELRQAAPSPDQTGEAPSQETADPALFLVEQLREDLLMPVKVQLHRQVALSFACIGFTLVGIPLGIRAHRRETTAGIAIALALVFIYYSFVILGQAFDSEAKYFPHLIVWIPNFLFQAVGAVLLWRANSKV
jgi:lipopolysaccharide export LptBFGC system permease protein LptF